MTAVDDRPASEVGNARKRKEDARLITGRTKWTDNITLPGLLHIAVLRSPMAHAKIVSVDVSGALEMPGTTSTGTPARTHAATSSIPLAKTWTSPPLRRTTRAPASARRTSSASMSRCDHDGPRGAFPTSTTSTPSVGPSTWRPHDWPTTRRRP